MIFHWVGRLSVRCPKVFSGIRFPAGCLFRGIFFLTESWWAGSSVDGPVSSRQRG